MSLLVLTIIISGCTNKACEIDTDCISSNTCEQSKCINNKCEYSIINDCCGNDVCEFSESYTSCATDCPNCDDSNKCTADSYDYHKEKCVNKLNFDETCCGNTRCEAEEDYSTCVLDCPDCNDDNICTDDSFNYRKQECNNEMIIPCCGNGICDEGAETFSNCVSDCPNCDDDDKLTKDSFNYETQICENILEYYLIEDFEQYDENWDFFRDEGWSTEVEDGNTVLRLIAANGNIPIVLDNYIFKFRFKWVEGNMHANFRQGNIDGEYNRYMIGMSHRGIDTLNKQSGKNFQTINEPDVSLDEGWHTLEIRNYNNIINIYVDDNLATKYEDTDNPILSGKVGFEVHTGGSPVTPEYLIDDVEIKIINEKDIIYP